MKKIKTVCWVIGFVVLVTGAYFYHVLMAVTKGSKKLSYNDCADEIFNYLYAEEVEGEKYEFSF